MKHKLLFFITLQIIFCCCTMGNHVRAQVTTVRIVPHTDNQCMLVDRERSSSFMGVKACRGNTVMYEAVGNNILQYEWTVTGGTYTLSAGQDICTVTWGNGDMGRIEVLAKGASDSKCSDWLEVLLEQRGAHLCHGDCQLAWRNDEQHLRLPLRQAVDGSRPQWQHDDLPL